MHGVVAYTYAFSGFAMPGIDAAVDELAGRGITVERYEGMNQDARGIARGIAAAQGPDIALFTDPAGNILAVLQNPPGPEA